MRSLGSLGVRTQFGFLYMSLDGCTHTFAVSMQWVQSLCIYWTYHLPTAQKSSPYKIYQTCFWCVTGEEWFCCTFSKLSLPGMHWPHCLCMRGLDL